MSSSAIIQPRKPREVLQDLIDEANRRNAADHSDAETSVLTPEDWDELEYLDCVSRIESLGSHYVALAQRRWAMMAAAVAARSQTLANSSPDDDGVAF